MSRYQCPLCSGLHPIAAKPRCPIHGTNHSASCAHCQSAAANPPCGR